MSTSDAPEPPRLSVRQVTPHLAVRFVPRRSADRMRRDVLGSYRARDLVMPRHGAQITESALRSDRFRYIVNVSEHYAKGF